jgi:hypothetical protein
MQTPTKEFILDMSQVQKKSTLQCNIARLQHELEAIQKILNAMGLYERDFFPMPSKDMPSFSETTRLLQIKFYELRKQKFSLQDELDGLNK